MRMIIVSLAAVTAIGFAVFGLQKAAEPQETNTTPKPNFIVIVLDDADSGMFTETSLREMFPNIGRIANEGIRFTNCHASTPVCAPSRASFLRGQYAHRTAVRVNDPAVTMANGFSGSYSEYTRREMHQDDLSVWLKNLGYRTMLVGKYLHHNFDFKVPPGWDDFYYSLGNKYFETYRFITAPNNAGSSSPLPPEQYRNTVEADDAVRLIENCTADGKQPFFLYLAPIAPHDPNNKDKWIEPQYRDGWPDLQLPATQDLNEQDVSDKPKIIGQMKPLDSQEMLVVQRVYRQRMLSVKSVDDMVGRIYATLEATGQIANTYIVFTSDHGFLLGQHRLIGKCLPYTESTSVPLFVRGPGVAQGVSAKHLIAHFDVAPTLVELAGGKAPSFVDGKSFAPLLAAPANYAEAEWRGPILIEHWETFQSRNRQVVTVFSALRMFDELFVEWANGESEYYDLEKDPQELENQFTALETAQKTEFRSTMGKIKFQDCDPIATVVSPKYSTSPKIGISDEITGMAEDDGGVANVKIFIRNPKTSLFWNGEAWQEESIGLFAALDRPQGLLTSWHHHPKLDERSPNKVDLVEVTAIAVDDEGNESKSTKAMEIQVDASRPETKFIRPTNNFNFVGQARIVGKTHDNLSVDQVQLVLRDMKSRAYWNGTMWSASICTISIKPGQSGLWSYCPPLTKGRFCVLARAVDAFGNVESSPATAVFGVR